MPEKKKSTDKKGGTEITGIEEGQSRRSKASSNPKRKEVRFLPCPGLSTEQLLTARKEHAAFFAEHGQVPKFKAHYELEDKQQIDYVRTLTAKNVWYYKDRLMTARGPCNLHVLRDCWVHGIIDENTLVWGQGLADWLPVRNVRTLVPQIRTVEVRVATWLKKQFGLKPAIARIRKERADVRRGAPNHQVDNMF